MRLVMHFSYGDGCTYSAEETHPIEYESAEAAIVDFEAAALRAYANQEQEIQFAGHTWPTYSHFENGKFYSPDFWTVDEWFEIYSHHY